LAEIWTKTVDALSSFFAGSLYVFCPINGFLDSGIPHCSISRNFPQDFVQEVAHGPLGKAPGFVILTKPSGVAFVLRVREERETLPILAVASPQRRECNSLSLFIGALIV
jgi:hypothetical protein